MLLLLHQLWITCSTRDVAATTFLLSFLANALASTACNQSLTFSCLWTFCSATLPWTRLYDSGMVIWPVLRRLIHLQEETWRARAGSKFGSQPWWLVPGEQPVRPPGWRRTSLLQPLQGVGILKQKESSVSFFEDPSEMLSGFRIPAASHHIQEIAQISEI